MKKEECGEEAPAGDEQMKRVIIESPYSGDISRNMAYLRAAMRDCLRRGESPFASHGLYTQPGVLDDAIAEERKLGIDAGFAWREAAELTVFYVDLGWSGGMTLGLEDCKAKKLPWESRRIGATEVPKHYCVGGQYISPSCIDCERALRDSILAPQVLSLKSP